MVSRNLSDVVVSPAALPYTDWARIAASAAAIAIIELKLALNSVMISRSSIIDDVCATSIDLVAS